MKINLSYDIEPKEVETFCSCINHVVDTIADVEIKESMTNSKIEHLEKLLAAASIMIDKFNDIDIDKINKIDKIKAEKTTAVNKPVPAKKSSEKKDDHNFKEVE